MSSIDTFLAARDLLFKLRTDHDTAVAEFRWPQLDEFNWALDHFDRIAETRGGDTALWVVNEDGSDDTPTFSEMVHRANQAANFLRAAGAARGDPILLSRPAGDPRRPGEFWEDDFPGLKG